MKYLMLSIFGIWGCLNIAYTQITNVGSVELGLINQMYRDPVNGDLYATGGLWTVNGGDSVDCVIRYSNNQWSDMPLDSGITRSGSIPKDICRFKNKLYIGGGLVNKTKYYGIAFYDNNQWNELSDSAYNHYIWKMLPTDSLLYIGGEFDTIGGVTTCNIATYDGQNFHGYPNMGNLHGGGIQAIALYNGELYVGGNILFDPGIPKQDILRWNGTAWTDVGGGLSGSITYVSSMLVYNNKLIVGGYFSKQSGDHGNSCMSWDGSNWEAMDLYTNPTDGGHLRGLCIHQGDLYAVSTLASGSFLHKWQNGQWNILATFDLSPICMNSWNGELYIGGQFNTVNGLPISTICKYSTTNGITPYFEEKLLNIFPNPGEDYVNIQIPNIKGDLLVEIYNSQGQKIQIPYQNGILFIKLLASGTYYVVAKDAKNRYKGKFIKK